MVKRPFDYGTKAVTVGFSLPEPVEHQKIDTALKRRDQIAAHACQGLRIETAPSRARSEGLRNTQPPARRDILKKGNRTAAVALSLFTLHDAGNAKTVTTKSLNGFVKHRINMKFRRKSYRGKPAERYRAHPETPWHYSLLYSLQSDL